MRTFQSKLLTCLLALCLSFVPTFAGASHEYGPGEEPSGEAVLADAVIVRPVGVLATVLGTAAFIVSLPFTIPSGSVGTAAKALVGAPAHYTFIRPIGDFYSCPDGSYTC